MKELSIEEKAKRYDNLLVKLQEAKVDNCVCDERYCCVIDDIVPELGESEDERNLIMAKIATTIEQSKTLIKLGIDVNTSDMEYVFGKKVPTVSVKAWLVDPDTVPAWSLAALLNMIPESIVTDNGAYQVYQMSIYNYDSLHCCDYVGELEHDSYIAFAEKEFVDAAFSMICWLLENKKL